MKVTTENAKEFAHNVMSQKDVEGYNKLNGTDYQTKEELLENETDEAVANFYQS